MTSADPESPPLATPGQPVGTTDAADVGKWLAMVEGVEAMLRAGLAEHARAVLAALADELRRVAPATNIVRLDQRRGQR